MRALGELLESRENDDAPAVYVGDTMVSRAELRTSADALGVLLRQAGVRPGQAVAAMLPNSAATVAALFGVWSADAAYMPVNPRLTDAEVARLSQAARPVLVVTDEAGAGRFPGLPTVVATDDGWRTPTRTVSETHAYDPGVALIQSTSGTTGRPKSVLLRHDTVLDLLEPVLRNLLGSRKTPTEGAPRKAPMPNLIPTSLSLWAGIYNVLFAFLVGAPVVLIDRFEPEGFAQTVKRFGIRSTVLPPAAMVMLCDAPRVTSLEPLRIVRSISAPLSPLQARRFRDRFGVTVLNCYGQTEIGGEIVGWNAADARAFGESKLGAVGRANPGVQVRVADDTGKALAADAQGEVQVRTPSLSSGYADGSQLHDRMTDDGWFRTGDIGHLDADGFLWIDGRLSDMINRGGLKVFPAEVEEVLRLNPAVAECAVVGVADDRLGEVPWAFVVLHPGADATDTDTELDALCREHVAPYKVPVRFTRLDALPRNDIGKVLSPRLVALAEAAAPR
ncbi:acyl--CoA ligase [Yinghuangia sp. ASG 101]|uniref:class I adenylate-forming enzyme family protein n=1 Tax=Yinghuangia sp. ASG 101 TaxID=2896848 RepID=UPI001E447028|nr:class I adenylate-forming enzyme family protein [Yinghuangia sp. ASG 101]UGQ11432.1 acyl--CoA ligase [Yinghuangia sp. ASG 101]